MAFSVHALRAALLRRVNLQRLRPVSADLRGDALLPVFAIASPPDMHLAPLAVLHGNPRIRHIILGNGISTADADWIRKQVGVVPVVQLKASLRGNAATYLAHAEVIRLCAMASSDDFCIQDADCFVTQSSWWDELHLTSPDQYAAGPFFFPIQDLSGVIPSTYLVFINKAAFVERERHGIRPDIASDANPLEALLRARGVALPYFPEAGKGYYDTLQKHWLAAVLGGEQFRPLPGADQVVFHIGGSTYLTAKEQPDVTHWDYWPLNTCYFHMRVLEFPRYARFKSRFSHLSERYGSADKLLGDYPEFKKSKRFLRSEWLLEFYKGFLAADRP